MRVVTRESESTLLSVYFARDTGNAASDVAGFGIRGGAFARLIKSLSKAEGRAGPNAIRASTSRITLCPGDRGEHLIQSGCT